MKRQYPTLLIAALVVLLFNNWLLAPLLNPHLPVASSLISEISAHSQPYHWVFQIGDILAGIVVLTHVPKMQRLVRRRKLPRAWLLVAMVAVIATDSIVDALLPISCAPSVDAHCQLAASHSLITYAHMAESTAAGVLIVLAPLVWWHACRRSHHRVARVSAGFLLVQLGTGLVILLAQARGWGIVGAAQRIYEMAIGAWLASLVTWPLRAVTAPAAQQSMLDLDQT